MDKLEIYDKNGNALKIEDVIYHFIKSNAETAGKNIDDVFVGVYEFTNTYIELYEAVDNGYDATDLNSFGEMLKVSKI